jgi:hypothetical protein
MAKLRVLGRTGPNKPVAILSLLNQPNHVLIDQASA